MILFGTKLQYSRKRRQDEEGKESNKAAIRDLVLTFCPTIRSVQQWKLNLLMPVLAEKLHFSKSVQNGQFWPKCKGSAHLPKLEILMAELQKAETIGNICRISA